jgi:glucokinase
VSGSVRRRAIDPHAAADELLNGFASAIADAHAAADVPWGVAIPGPFDYRRGIGLFKDVGKFDALLDVNLTARLHAVLPHLTGDITFVNDADAFAVGEWRQGVTAAATRCVGITLGSGVGSSFLDNGIPVTTGPTVPPHGRAHRLKVGTSDLEDVVSRRAILARYLAGPNVTSTTDLDVLDVFDRSRGGEAWATQVLEDAFGALGGALAPWFTRFQAVTVALEGAMTGSWDLILPPLRSGLTTAGARIGHLVISEPKTERSPRNVPLSPATVALLGG